MHIFSVSILKDKATHILEGKYCGAMTIHDLIEEAYKTGEHDGWYECLNGSKKETSMQYKLLKDLPDAPRGTIIKPTKINETEGYRHLNFTSEYMDKMPGWFRRIELDTLEVAVGKVMEIYPDQPLSFYDAMRNLREVYESTRAK